MENKENNKNLTIDVDVFSVLNSAGWFLTISNIAGITQLPWNAVLGYWLILLGTSVVLGSLTALIGLLVNKGGDKGGEK